MPVVTGTCDPEFGQAAYNFFIRDTAAVDSAVGTVTATDPDDGDTVSYSITAGNDSGKFSVNGTYRSVDGVGGPSTSRTLPHTP